MATLMIRLCGPMQSWGVRSRYDYRDTWPYPTKSGVLGLLCAALGRDRYEPIEDLAALRMGVRVDRPGTLKVDYQTASQVMTSEFGVRPTVQSWRSYLSDAAFLVGLEGDDGLLSQCYEALLQPRWPLYLGRKSYVPSPPPWLRDGLTHAPLEAALRSYPYLGSGQPKHDLLLVLEVPSNEGRLVQDQPAGPFAERRFLSRYVREIPLPRQEVPTREESDVG